MDGLVSKIRSKATGGHEPGQAPTHTIFFCPSELGDRITVRHASNPKDAPPIFDIQMSDGMYMSCGSKEPDYRFFQNGHLMADARCSMSSSKVKMTLRGIPIEMKQSELSGNFSVNAHPLPALKWKVNQVTGGSLTLCDESGVKLAKIGKSSRVNGADAGQKLEIFVPADDFFVELCVVSGYAAWIINRVNNKVIKEVVKAVAGAS
jgi:hypothetical protein